MAADPLAPFHPIVARWFAESLGEPYGWCPFSFGVRPEGFELAFAVSFGPATEPSLVSAHRRRHATQSNHRPDMRTPALLAASLMIIPTMVKAQRSPVTDSIPHAGEWAAEAIIGEESAIGATLVRFTSPRFALLVGTEFGSVHSKTEFTNTPNAEDRSSTSSMVNARLGLRSYRPSSTEKLRPVVGAGVRGGYSWGTPNNFRAWNAGVYAELGAVYFVASHFSLGATGELSALYQKEKQSSDNLAVEATVKSFHGSLVRVLAAVYF